MKRLILSALLLTVIASGCVATNATMLAHQGVYAPVSPAYVQVYMSEQDVKAPFEKVAVIHAEGESRLTNETDMIEAAKVKAAAVGANAIILSKIDEPSPGAKVAATVLGVGVMRHGQIVAIHVKE